MTKKLWIGVAILLAAVVILLLVMQLWPKPEKADIVGICYREGGNKENAGYRESLEKALSGKGYQLIVKDADQDQSKQLTQIQELAQQQCDVLLIEPVMADGAPELMEKVTQLGIPAVLFNKPLDATAFEPYADVYYIGYPYSNTVLNHMEMMTALSDGGDCNGDGTVSCLLLAGPKEHRDSVQYQDSLLACMPDNLEILSQVNTEDTLESGRKLCKQALATYGKDIEVILCGSDQIALGADQAITDGGRTVGKDVYLFGIGGDSEGMALIWQGKMSGTVYADPAPQIETICKTVDAVFQGRPIDKIQILPFVSVTKENVEDYWNAEA